MQGARFKINSCSTKIGTFYFLKRIYNPPPIHTQCGIHLYLFHLINFHIESNPKMATLKGAIITGAASGVGLALTKHLLSKGWHVVMSDINEAGDGIAKELGGKIFFCG